MWKRLGLIFYICVCWDTSVATERRFSKTANSKFGYTYDSFPAQSASMCCAQCLTDTNCRSVNYIQNTGTCELNNNGPEGLLSEILPYDGIDFYHMPLVPCPQAWSTLYDNCYLVDSTKRTWTDCQAFCESKDSSNLTSIHTTQENNFIENLATFADLLNQGWAVWIGMGDYHNNPVWSDGSGLGATFFTPGEPNGRDIGVGENCLEMEHGGTWNDKGCDTKWPCVCKLNRDFVS